VIGQLFVFIASIIGLFYFDWYMWWDLTVKFFTSVPAIYYIFLVSGIILQVIGIVNTARK